MAPLEERATPAALPPSPEHFRELAESVREVFWLTDTRSGQVLYVSPAYELIWGRPCLSLYEDPGSLLDAIHPEDRERVKAGLGGPAGGGYEGEYRIQRPDGSIRWVRSRTFAIGNEHGEPQRIAGISEDITERKKAETELEERTRLLTFCADVGAALARGETLQASLEQCCQAMVRHLGGDFASVWTLRAWGDLLDLQADAGPHASQLARSVTVPVGRFRIGRIAQERKPFLVDLPNASIHEDDKDWAGRAGMVAFAGYPLVVEDRLVGVMAMYARRPLTEAALRAMGAVADQIALGIDRARAAEAVRASEESIRSLLHNMLVGVITIDGRGLVESLNPAAESMFGYGRDELVGKHFRVLLPDPARTDPEDLLRRVYQKAIGRVTEWEGRRKNGQVFPLELTMFEFMTPAGRRLAGCLRDLSERREIDRMKAEFIATVSHELRTPLTCVIGYLDLLGSGHVGELPEKARDSAARALAAALRLQALTNDILDLTRLDAGRLEMDLRDVAIKDVIATSLATAQALADKERISLEVASSSGRVFGDRDRLAQVLVNLLSNAIKFSPAGSAVTISTKEDEGCVEVRVEDRGRGVPAAFLSSIFDRFRQVEAADSRQKGGVGLGLTICRAIVEQHHGTIGVESEEGKGSAFSFRIPSTSVDSVSAGHAPAGPVEGKADR